MKIFADTAEISELKELVKLGAVDGVTTNPSLIAKSGKDIFEVTKEICQIIDGPVSAEVVSTESAAMIKEGLKLRKIANNIVVKIPLTWEGLKACKALSSENIMTNVTLCFSTTQALLAAKAGATFVSPFVGRIDDIGQDGMQLIADIVNIFNNYHELRTEVLVASVRNVNHVHEAAMIGADAATIPPKIIHELVKHELTDKGLEKFLEDWKKTGQRII